MSAQKEVFAFIKSISGQSNVLTIPRVFVTLAKSHRAALVLSQCIYWSDKSRLGDGWFYKSYAEWRAELGIPKQGMMTAIKTLKEHGWLEVKTQKADGAPTNHYRVDLQRVSKDISKILDSTEPVL